MTTAKKFVFLLIGLFMAVPSLPAVSIDPSSHAWSLTRGSGVSGSLLFKGKAKTLWFVTCPSGLVAGNFIYIAGGSGVSESAAITAVSCPSGNPGSVTIATRHAHLGKWSVATSTAGIQEAIADLGSGGGTVLISAGDFEVHSRITLTSHIALQGAGINATTIRVGRDEFRNSAPWQYGINPSGTVIFGPPGHSGIAVTDLSVTFEEQSSPPNGAYGVAFVDVNDSMIDAVAVRDGPILKKGNTFLPIGVLGLSQNDTVQNSQVYNRPCSISSEGSGGFISGGRSNRFLHNYVTNGCNSSYVTAGTGTLFEGNVFELGRSTMVPGAQAFAADNSSGALFVNNRCIGNGIAPACFSAVTDAKTPETSDSTFIGNEARDCGQGFQFQSTVGHSRRIRVEKGLVSNCAVPLSLMGIVDDVLIQGVSGLRDIHSPRIVAIPVISNFLHDVPTVDGDLIWMTDAEVDYSVGGFKGGSAQRRVHIINASRHAMMLSQGDLKSVAENRICVETGADPVSPSESIAILSYSGEKRCWTIVLSDEVGSIQTSNGASAPVR